MSNELRINYSLEYSKNGASVSKTKDFSIDITGNSFTNAVQTVGTSEESLSVHPDIGTVGYVLIINLDDTNFLEVGSTSGVYDIKVMPGEFAIYRHNSNTIYAKADTAPVDAEFAVFEL